MHDVERTLKAAKSNEYVNRALKYMDNALDARHRGDRDNEIFWYARARETLRLASPLLENAIS